jgi:hypothetical protein
MKLHLALTFGLGLARSFNLCSAGVCSGGNNIMSFRDVIEQSLNGSGNSNSAIPPQSIVGGTEVRLEASHAFLFLSAYQLKLSHATYPSSP